MRISDWSSDVCSSDLPVLAEQAVAHHEFLAPFKVQIGSRMRKDIGVDQLAHRAGTALHELELLGLAEIHAGLRNTLDRSEEHTSELQSLMRISYAVFCLKNNTILKHTTTPADTFRMTRPGN